MPSARRKARIIALQALYEFDCVGHDPLASTVRMIEEKSLTEDAALFAQEIVGGVLENTGEIDSQIERFAPNYPVAQLAAVDKAILRLAIFEMMFRGGVPIKVVINEAVELAKLFGSKNSSKFINGVLGSISTVVPQR